MVKRHAGVGVLLFGLAVAPPMQAQEANGTCATPVGRDFSLAAPAEAGVSATRLVQLTEALDAGRYDLRSLLVLRDCRLIYERYKHNVRRDFNHSVYSVTKSFTATLAGILQHEGKLPSFDAPVSTIVPRPDRMPDDIWAKAGRITPRNVMQMSSGLDYIHDPSKNPIYSLRIDRFAHALQPDFKADPGAHYQYSDGDVSITGAVVAAAAGQNLYRSAKILLFEPLQMANHDWWFMDAAGRDPGGWGLRLRPMDMLKLGQLYLQGCQWNGRQLCRPSFIAEAWSPGRNAAYGLHWWLGRMGEKPVFSARGFKGQRIVVIPSERLVVAMTATLTGAEERAVDALLSAAMAEAMQAGIVPDPTTLTRLSDMQKVGFNGETRIVTEDQDIPRR
ncbi:serine hydrolase [Ferrovibrio terrae]|uniref:serine hydrolase domain-containing protein n=1 Tax=Ferrovibrio terrae TaxID=2594003 RepID=UPI0031381FF9